MATDQRRRRADAERSIASIVEAATEVFASDAKASMTHVAQAAGVGRVTLYAHFPSRAELLAAVIDRALAETSAILEERGFATDDGPADEQFFALVRTTWPMLDRLRRVREAALAELGPAKLRKSHSRVFGRIERLIERARSEGVFRDDLPAGWLTAMVYAVIHGAADEVDAGRQSPKRIPDLLEATLRTLLAKSPQPSGT